jgi:uncharacterized protein (TIGR03435 family)
MLSVLTSILASVFAIVAMPGGALFAQEAGGTPRPMAADANPAFEVAAIKPTQSREAGGTFRVSPGGLFNATNFPVTVLIQFAYNVPRRQISGGPSWLETDKFDIVGKPDAEGAPNMGQLRVMLQKLLADRFQLSIHREKKELSVYALTVARGGPKLTESTGSPNGLPAFFGGGPKGRTVQNSTMAEFASDLQGTVPDRPVVDQTGLGPKRYDFVLKWTPFAPATNAATTPPSGDNLDAPPDIFAAIQQQLGLKLESTKAPVGVIVIDHVERPSEN